MLKKWGNREYPGAPDRGGSSADYDNFVSLLQNIRRGLGEDYGLSITLPANYWYMQYFDIVKISKTIDWVCVILSPLPISQHSLSIQLTLP